MVQMLMLIEIDRLAMLAGILECGQVGQIVAVMADRLEGWVGSQGWSRRLQGDRFIAMVPIVAESDQSAGVEERLADLQREMGRPVILQPQAYTLTVSVGMVLGARMTVPLLQKEPQSTDINFASHFPARLDDWSDRWLQNAQTALLCAQERGAGQWVRFNPDLHQALRDRLALEMALRDAISQRSLELHYQPIVDLDSGETRGFEALCRWDHADLGGIPPSTFIALAEELGLMVELGTWVLETACAQMVAWQRQGLVGPTAKISVNVSPQQLDESSFGETVRWVLGRTGLDPHCLALEVVEMAFAQPDIDYVPVLKALRGVGISISMDDFGTGYSSLSRLTQLPIDTLKVDRAFVEQMEWRGEDVAMMQVILGLAQTLGLEVVAEGASKACHVEMLRALGRPLIQGYFYSRALPPAAVPEWLAIASAG